MLSHNPDGELIALRHRLECWLLDHAKSLGNPDDIEASNIALWAQTFIQLTDEESKAAEARLKEQGAREFVLRVKQCMADKLALVLVPDTPNFDTLGRAFFVEYDRLNLDEP